MVILSLDPGIARTGYAVLKQTSQKITALDYGCIETPVNFETKERLLNIYNELNRLILFYKPEVMVLEQLFFNTNQKTGITVSQAQGVMLLAAAEAKILANFLTPLQIKIALTGYGRADKKGIERMVLTILELKTKPKLDDTVDALACGIAFLSQISLSQKVQPPRG